MLGKSVDFLISYNSHTGVSKNILTDNAPVLRADFWGKKYKSNSLPQLSEFLLVGYSSAIEAEKVAV